MTTLETPLRRYFRLPTEIKAVDFVHQIDRAATAETIEKTLRLYQVTPSIARNLRTALDHVKRGLADKRSIFTWIHGSFGCGKSHFMNVLTLLLADEKAVYTVHPELQAHRQEFPDVIGRKVFRLHVQCISRGATTLEEIVFGSAVEELARRHPTAPMPGLFESGRIFASAAQLLADLGDAKFFAAFPSNKRTEDDSDWGEIAAWDRKRFDAAIAKPQSDDARALAGELAKTPWLEGIAAGAEYVKLGPGLQILAAHLKRLGYEGIVLFLDELVLWLSTFQDPKKLALETPKVSTLVEHGDYPPVLPYLTFAARQRDLSEMVGKLAVGRDEVVFRDQLSFWKDRFETISLEDKDLPRIIEKRVLQSASPQAKEEIDHAFESYRRSFAQDFRQLTGNQGDAEDFRRVYPFSPALVEVMVAVSATLQRDRTALRELSNLLVNYLPDFELGKVVPVGDLFDVVVHGQTSDLPAIQRVYEQARRIYENDLLPHIRKKQKTDTPERCQLKREEFDARLGCSGCPESACRTQTRIAKTVLLQGLVPNTPVLKELTASSLVYLNSGTLKSRVPNQETALAATLLREWGGVTPAVHVKGEANPEVRAVLDTVDVRRILDMCRDLDNQQRRRIRVRDLLFDRMGVTRKEQMGSRTFDWRGRKWSVGVVYDNARLANDNVFRPGEDEDLRVILDFPFDDPGFGPRQDEERIAQVLEALTAKEAARGLATIAWLPSFLNEDAQGILADLVILDGLVDLRDQDLATRVTFVSMEEIPRVRSTLEQQREHKRAIVEHALESAYQVSHAHDAQLAPNLSPERHAHLLRSDSRLNLPADGLFDQSLQALLKQALETRAPRHPVFTKPPTKQRLETVLELLDRLLETPGGRTRFSRTEIEDLRGIAAAEHLGIVRIIEEDAALAGGILEQAGRNLANQRGPLSVGAVRAALDPDGLMELSPDIQDFLVLAYAKMAPKPFRLIAQGQSSEKLVGRLTDDMGLVPVDMPSASTWQAAIHTVGLLGVSLNGKALTPWRLDELASRVTKAAEELGDAQLREALALLAEWQRLAGVTDAIEVTPRGEILLVLRELVGTVRAAGSSLALVDALAGFAWNDARTTAIVAMAKRQTLVTVLEVLRSDSLKSSVGAGHRLESDPTRRDKATPVMARVRSVLVSDENIEPLRRRLDLESTHITQILVGDDTGNRGGGATGGAGGGRPTTGGGSASEVREIRSAADVERLASDLREKLDGGQRVAITIEIVDGERR